MKQARGIKQGWILGEYLIDLAELLDNGISLREGLELLTSDAPHNPVEQALHQVTTSVAKGGDFTLAIESAFPSLPKFCIEIIRQAQKEHDLPNALLRLGNYMLDMQSFSLKSTSIGKSLIYPAALSIIGIVILTMLMLFVIPQFKALFREFGAELPPITQNMIDLSAYLADSWETLATIIFLIFIAWRYLFPQFPLTRRLKGFILLRIPVLNNLYRLSIETQLTRTLGLLGANKTLQLKFLQAAEQLLSGSYAGDKIVKVIERTKSGYSLPDAFSKSGLFTRRFITMLRMAQRQGLKEGLLLRQAERNKRILNDAPNFNRMLEPVLMTIMGLILGYLVVAMYLPIFQLGALM
jgi:type IV pilus assembly protein PilC